MSLLNRRRALMSLNENILPSLPSMYQQVEYIQSTGAQYIDTGYVPSENTEILMTFEFIQKGRVFGANTDAMIATYSSALEGIQFKFGDSKYYSFESEKEKKYSLRYNKTGVLIDDALQFTFAYTTFDANSSLSLCNTNTGTSGTLAKLKIYTLKIFNDNILVRNFIPCYRKSDNIIGLYDLVESVFYTNNGIDTFLKGGNV